MASFGCLDEIVSTSCGSSEAKFAEDEEEGEGREADEQYTILDAFASCGSCTAARKPLPLLAKANGEGNVDGVEHISIEGNFERRGLRRWDVLWNSSFAELQGRVLTVYDVDAFEGERTLLAHTVLSEEFEVVRLSETEWRVRPCPENSAYSDLQFEWRSPDARCAQQWIDNLQKACLPQVPLVAVTHHVTDGDTSEAIGHAAVILRCVLSPALLGYSALDPAAVTAVAGIWSHIVNMVHDAVITHIASEKKEAKLAPEDALRPFQRATLLVKACLLHADDVELNAFLELCDFINEVQGHMGSWMGPFRREGFKNSAMIRSRLDQTTAKVSMRALLKSEVDAGIHSPNGILADPSGAIAVLWAYRGFSMWTAMVRRCAMPSSWGVEPPADLMKASFEHAYDIEIKQFHGSLMRTAVGLATSVIPRWEDVWEKYGPTLEEVQQDVEQWQEGMEELLPRIDAMVRGYDLYDVRKTF